MEFLRAEVDEFEGHVFYFAGPADTVAKRFSKLGRRAKIVSATRHNGSPVFASAHDLRRSFGERWASEVESPMLQKLMRHKSIQTTMTYYANVNAHKIGEKINEAFNRATSRNSTADQHDDRNREA